MEEAGEKGIHVFFSRIKDIRVVQKSQLADIIGHNICIEKGAATTPLATQ